ncbi:MAG: endolytic transglycosylase MltG, partial [Gemmatimonadota bacterium]
MTRRILLATSFLLWGCGHPAGDPVEFLVPQGASLTEVVDTLRAHDVVRWPGMFELYARAKGDGAHIKAGRYAMRAGSSWGSVLEALTSGRVLTVAMTIPEGFRLGEMAPRIAAITGEAPDTVLAALRRPGIDSTYQVPGPGLEGYL